MANYGFQKEMGADTAVARVDRVDASYRDLCNVCSNIRGRKAGDAVQFLSEAFEKKRPIRYFRHNKRRGHLRELGGKKGGWPVKSVKIVLNVLKNAVANANSKGLGECRIVHVAANKQDVYGRMSPKGRRVRQDFETAFVEIVLKELNTPENKARSEEMKKRIAQMAIEMAAEKEKTAAKKNESAKIVAKNSETVSKLGEKLAAASKTGGKDEMAAINEKAQKAGEGESKTASTSRAVVKVDEPQTPAVVKTAEKKNGVKKKMTYKDVVEEQHKEENK